MNGLSSLGALFGAGYMVLLGCNPLTAALMTGIVLFALHDQKQ